MAAFWSTSDSCLSNLQEEKIAKAQNVVHVDEPVIVSDVDFNDNPAMLRNSGNY